jgi:hypothetical protein
MCEIFGFWGFVFVFGSGFVCFVLSCLPSGGLEGCFGVG